MHQQQSPLLNAKRLVKRKKLAAKKQSAKKNVQRLATKNVQIAKVNAANAKKNARKRARQNVRKNAKQQKQSAKKTAKRLVAKNNTFPKARERPSWNPTWSFSCFSCDITLSLQ